MRLFIKLLKCFFLLLIDSMDLITFGLRGHLFLYNNHRTPRLLASIIRFFNQLFSVKMSTEILIALTSLCERKWSKLAPICGHDGHVGTNGKCSKSHIASCVI